MVLTIKLSQPIFLMDTNQTNIMDLMILLFLMMDFITHKQKIFFLLGDLHLGVLDQIQNTQPNLTELMIGDVINQLVIVVMLKLSNARGLGDIHGLYVKNIHVLTSILLKLH